MRAPSTSPGWTASRIETLTRLWLAGLSAGQIAKQLGGGMTRSAVLGKLYRLRLCGRIAASPPGRVRLRPATPNPVCTGPARAKRPVTPPSASKPRSPRQLKASLHTIVSGDSTPDFTASAEGPGLARSLIELGAHGCRWPFGDPQSAGFSFYGRLAEGSYCPTHRSAAHQDRRPKPIETDAALLRQVRGRVPRRAA